MATIVQTPPPTSTPAVAPSRRVGNRWRNTVAGWSFILPNFVGFGLLTMVPVLVLFYVAFTKWNVFRRTATWIGTKNFEQLWHDKTFWTSLWNTLYYTVFHIPLTMAAALGLALLLNRKLRGVAFFRTAAFFPYITSIVALTYVWNLLFSPEYGPSLATPTALLFFIALATPAQSAANVHTASVFGVPHHAWSTLVGALWGIAVQVAMWPVNAQHPLRRIVGESWLAAAELFDRIVPDLETRDGEAADPAERHKGIGDAESKFRTTLDANDAALHAAAAGAMKSRREFIAKLQRLELFAAERVIVAGPDELRFGWIDGFGLGLLRDDR